MQNLYTETDTKYSEIAEAIEDFEYGTYVKCRIASLTPLQGMTKSTINISNIMNKDVKALGITQCDSSGYIKLFIPKEMSTYDNLHDHIHNDIHDHVGTITPAYYDHTHVGVVDKDHTYKWKGKKGEKFVVLFVGGDINKCTVIGRYR